MLTCIGPAVRIGLFIDSLSRTNGMRSIIAHTPGQNFPRVRVGVGAKPDGWDLADWVLSKYTIREEQIAMQQAFERAADCVEDWVKNGIDHAMQEYNKTV